MCECHALCTLDGPHIVACVPDCPVLPGRGHVLAHCVNVHVINGSFAGDVGSAMELWLWRLGRGREKGGNEGERGREREREGGEREERGRREGGEDMEGKEEGGKRGEREKEAHPLQRAEHDGFVRPTAQQLQPLLGSCGRAAHTAGG